MSDLVKLAARINRLHAEQLVLLDELRKVTLTTSLQKVQRLKREFERNRKTLARLESKLQ